MALLIADIIARLKIPGLQEAHARETASLVISELLGVEVAPKQIQIKKETLFLNSPVVIKTAVKLREKEIINALQTEKITIIKIL